MRHEIALFPAFYLRLFVLRFSISLLVDSTGCQRVNVPRRLLLTMWLKKVIIIKSACLVENHIQNDGILGRGAVRLARLHGVQEVGGSNSLAPTVFGDRHRLRWRLRFLKWRAREKKNLVHFLCNPVDPIHFHRLLFLGIHCTTY